jgi:hypothetical protein
MTDIAKLPHLPISHRWGAEVATLLDDYTIPQGDGHSVEFYSVPHELMIRVALVLADPLYQPAPSPRPLTAALAAGGRLADALGTAVRYDGLADFTHDTASFTPTTVHSDLPALQADPNALAAAEDAAWAVYESLPVSASMVIDDINHVTITLTHPH